MTEDDLEQFHNSLTRCAGNPRFIERFYELFLASSDAVREKFKDTNFKKQRRVLQGSLYMMMLAADGQPESLTHLERLAEVHGPHGRNIPPQMYTAWLDCLIQAVQEADPRFAPQTEVVWRRMMAKGIEFMKAHYTAQQP